MSRGRNSSSRRWSGRRELIMHHCCTFHRQAMIDEFDLDQDNEISEQEFIRCVVGIARQAVAAQLSTLDDAN